MTKSDLTETWNLCLQIFKDNVSDSAYNTWFLPIVPLKYEENKLVIQVPSQFCCDWLEEHYIDLLCGAIRKCFGNNTQLMYNVVVDGGEKQDGTFNEPSSNKSILPQQKPENEGNKTPSELKALDPHLISDYTFDTFVEGESNKFPRSISLEVAKKPADTPFNPLFIYGPSGVGKTHLVNAIGLKIKELHPELRVLYISAHLFQVQFVDATLNNKQNDFIHFYQTIDVLIIDDIQEIAGVTKTQNTLFHIFNHLYRNKKQLIFTSDRSPVLLTGLQERLITRLKCGIPTELERPTEELRKNILRNKLYRNGLQFPDNVIDFVAENVTDSIRELEGVINSIMAHSTVYNREIDLDMAKEIIRKIVKYEKKSINIDDILHVVCKQYGLEFSAIHTKSRKSEIVLARQVAMYLAKKYTDYSTSKIGQLIGNKNHATVIYAFRMVKEQAEVSKAFRAEIKSLEETLEGKSI
jgi:chromosomal replication initiator protein